MAKQANGAVIIRSGESVVLVTACTAPEPKPNANFFPLTVDYREYTYSADPVRDPSTLAIVGAGASLAISDIPFGHVLAAVRVGMVNGVLVANPTYEETKAYKVNIVVAGTGEGIVMVESGAQQVSEADVLAAIEFGHDCCKKIAVGIRELMKKCGKAKKEYVTPE